ncbi:hypothetical protein BDA99DRAFT_537971 [Phascolomyces articulosus]|uniref:Uncharacterized protein n=1 Tax=Phascolomyces articulosus TaxID=60185 RepID=A0AAD5JZD4_9FUNG|nr:hypothetical protein BDA99DRAFT_537971 [Phascolomyces articulosus]
MRNYLWGVQNVGVQKTEEGRLYRRPSIHFDETNKRTSIKKSKRVTPGILATTEEYVEYAGYFVIFYLGPSDKSICFDFVMRNQVDRIIQYKYVLSTFVRYFERSEAIREGLLGNICTGLLDNRHRVLLAGPMLYGLQALPLEIQRLDVF